MAENVLKNGGFEADWGDERSHRCLIFPEGAEPYEKNVGNIFTPPGWVTWFHHKPGTWDQPEVRDAWKQGDARRVHSGQKGMLLFTFFRGHDAGFLQRVRVAPGCRLRLTAWAHAWSNNKFEGHEDCYDNARCSCGVGKEAAFVREGEAPALSGDPWTDAIQNFTFYVGIDPTGGADPTAAAVVWGQGAHIYNAHAQVIPVEAVAEGSQVTVFLRSKARWPFKHNDAYWDDAELIVLEPGQVVGKPEVRLAYRPVNLKVGDKLTVEARSLADLASASLEVIQPSGAALGTGPVVAGRDGEWHTWTHETDPTSEAGVHIVKFSAAGDVEAAAAFDCAPEVRLSSHPPEPKVGDVVTVEARSLTALNNVHLVVVQPSGAALAAGPVVVRRDGEWHTWTYVTDPALEVGVHAVTFYANDGVEATATFDCAERPHGHGPAVEEERGQPRMQYERVYVLLPQGGDARWAQAVIDATWNRYHYTIGGSADDAGIGDLDFRRVIAINPREWPTDLRAFFDEHYPGVAYVAVEAATPDELKRKLERL